MKILLIALVFAFSSLAFAARPAAPVITVEVSQIKQLTFEWQPLTGVTQYQLWFKASDEAAWVKYTEKPAPRTSITASVAVHLLEWPQARYQLKACNTDGCSTSNTVRVNHGEKLVAMGFFKPDTPTGVASFGGQLAVSADGSTLAALAGEVVNGNTSSLVIYVYRRTSAGWRRDARLVPSTVQPFTAQLYLGDPVALSGDGNLLAVGAWYENGSGDSAREAGAVYLFRRSGSTWHEAQKVTGQNVGGDNFGLGVKLDDAGHTLAVAHTVAGEARSEGGTVEVYRDPADASDQFVHDLTVNVPMANGAAQDCGSIAFSGDGQSLLRTCYDRANSRGFLQVLRSPGFAESSRILLSEGQRSPDVSFDGATLIVMDNGAATIYRLGASGWASEARLGSFGAEDYGGGRRVAISRDGKIAAIGVPSDVAAGLGPIFPPYQTAETDSGGVVVHERRSTGWVLRRLVKPGSANHQWGGWAVALGDNGRVLAAGSMFDPSAATGINGDRDDDSAPNRGAVWLY